MMRIVTFLLFIMIVIGGFGIGSGSDRMPTVSTHQKPAWSPVCSTSCQLVGASSFNQGVANQDFDKLGACRTTGSPPLPVLKLLPANSIAATVKGRIELTNSKLKPRDGKIDASGVTIWLAALDGSKIHSASKQRKIITQRNKRFAPHIVAVETGSEVDFPNEDPFFHNVFSIFNGKRFDLGLYASGETRPVNFTRAGISYIFCNIHPQMSAVVIALDTPYFAVSDKSGGFAINNVPAGNYRLNIWHERAKQETLASLSRLIQVGGAGLDAGAIAVSEEGYVPRPHPNKHGQDYDQQQPNYRKP